MSTLRVNKLENTNTSNGGISIDTSGHVSIDGANFPTAGPLSNRNRWINGAMVVDQRRGGASKSSANGGDYIVDRLRLEATVNGKCTIGQNLNSVTPPVGFKKYAGVQVTSTHSLGVSDHFNFSRWIEGYDITNLEQGTANAKSFTISFWVRSSVIGTYGLSVLGYNGVTFRHHVKEYTINSTDWEYKTITIQGDTSSTITWNTTNGTGLFVEWNLGAGTNVQTTADTWTTGLFRSTSNQTNLFATNGATFYLTGVQVEVGTVATPFEHKSYGDELAKCQRYYYECTSSTANKNMNQQGVLIAASSTAYEYMPIPPVPMRAAPSCSLTNDVCVMRLDGGSSFITVNLQGTDFLALPNGNGFSGHMWGNRTSGTGFSPGNTGRLCTGSVPGKLAFSAEL